ncbi:MAG: Phytoene desaturase (lycopene-forming) [Alphaproteobacteria bacterium MarineAlpha9_Bin4]|nr:phytoene dehydrogenase [Pelagibacterales bacterium]PPR27072.1 MAG: Phytoene desaturase (lycopene-forming) [Alphaproteobacteria bacterium MarineAlpha9_Bin4]|tara:strand:- start:627 stop:2087 length:1461 start_codon:yes stop_codon:yes gene_type:complete
MKKAIVIGAGFGGMASALRLKKKGYQVEIIDRCNNLGGRAQFFDIKGFKYDAGPTIITAPFLFKELFRIHNKKLSDYVTLKPLKVWYRFVYNDGSYFDYENSVSNTINNIQKINKNDAKNYNNLLMQSKKIYDLAFCELADKPFHNLSTMLRQIPSLLKFRSYQSVYKFTCRYLESEKLRRAFSIQPLLVGGNPFETTCIYSLIHYLERAHGVYFAMGGTGNLVRAFSKLIKDVGIQVTLNTTINKFNIKDGKICSILDHKGKKREADVYISNMDPLYLYKNVIKLENKRIFKYKKKYAKHSMGLFVLFFGTNKQYNKIEHHTILFGKEYYELLVKIFKKYQLPEDISIYLHRPTATDKSFAPKGCDSFYALVPVPNLLSKNIYWKNESEKFKNLIIRVLEKRLMPDLRKKIVQCFYMTPLDFKERYLSDAGAGFSLAPFFTQSAWFRFHNKSEIIKNLYLVGAGTHPGAGLPGVLSSARVLEKLL